MTEDKSKELLEMLNETMPNNAEEMIAAKFELQIAKVDVPHSSKRTPRSDIAESVYTKRWPKNRRGRKRARKRAKKSRRTNRRKK